MGGRVRIGLVGLTNDVRVVVGDTLREAGVRIYDASGGIRHDRGCQGWIASWSAWITLRSPRARGPVAVVTRSASVRERIECLDAGADAVLDLADDERLLRAELNAFARRLRPRALTGRVALGPIRIDGGEVRLGSASARVGATARRLLEVLCDAGGEVVPVNELLARAWPDATVSEGSLRYQVAELRKALAGSGVEIENARGVGYRLERRGERGRGREGERERGREGERET